MKVTCFKVGDNDCMNIVSQNPHEAQLIQHLSDGTVGKKAGTVCGDDQAVQLQHHFPSVTEDNYSSIADLCIPGVPESYGEFKQQVDLHEKAVREQDEKAPIHSINPGASVGADEGPRGSSPFKR